MDRYMYLSESNDICSKHSRVVITVLGGWELSVHIIHCPFNAHYGLVWKAVLVTSSVCWRTHWNFVVILLCILSVHFLVLCSWWQAYYRDMLGPKYVWITQGFYPEGWWRDSVNSSCPPNRILAALNNSFAIVPDGYFVNEDKSAMAISTRVS